MQHKWYMALSAEKEKEKSHCMLRATTCGNKKEIKSLESQSCIKQAFLQ